MCIIEVIVGGSSGALDGITMKSVPIFSPLHLHKVKVCNKLNRLCKSGAVILDYITQVIRDTC